MPYNLGPSNQYNASSTYLSPYDWLYGPYAPPFVLENFDDLAFNEVWSTSKLLEQEARVVSFDAAIFFFCCHYCFCRLPH